MSVSEITVYWQEGQRLIPGEHTDFSPSPTLRFRATSYRGDPSPGTKRRGRESGHAAPSSDEITNAKVFPSFPICLQDIDKFLWLTQNAERY
jgi:hypothetical protein